MNCYDCFESGIHRNSIGLCHHCSAAICAEPAVIVPDSITTVEPLFRSVALPKRARLLLCATCEQALFQTHEARSIDRADANLHDEPALAHR